VSDALGAVWNPDRNVTTPDGTRTVALATTLADPQAWLRATGQIFFTLSLGMGVLMTYASYLKHSDDVALNATTAAAGNEVCEVVLGGLMTVPAAVLFLGAGILVTVPGLFGLGFVALPQVFAQMPGGQVFGFLFFFLLFLAALTSSLSMLQPAVAFLEEGFALGRRQAVLAVGALTLPGGILAGWLTGGLTALDTMDFWMGNLGVILCALFILVAFAWLWGLRTGMAELRRNAGIPVPGIVAPVIAVVAPLALVAVLVAFLVGELAGGGRIAALADHRVLIPAAYAIGMGVLFIVLGARALPRLRAQIGDAP
jgi:SNF family Na+-dependent transporter